MSMWTAVTELLCGGWMAGTWAGLPVSRSSPSGFCCRPDKDACVMGGVGEEDSGWGWVDWEDAELVNYEAGLPADGKAMERVDWGYGEGQTAFEWRSPVHSRPAHVQKRLLLNTVIRSCIESRNFLCMNGSVCRTLMPVV